MTDTSQASWRPGDPVAAVTITEPDTMTVAVFGLPYTFPDHLQPLTRASFGQAMDHLWGVLRRPFTVEVTEVDGTRQTGVIDLRTSPDTTTVEGSTPVADDGPQADLTGVTGGGYLPRRLIGDPTDTPGLCLVEEAAWVRVVDESDDASTPDTTGPDVTPGLFWPGEQITVGLIAGVTTADDTGHPTGHVPAWLDTDLLIAGRSSGVIQTIPRRHR